MARFPRRLGTHKSITDLHVHPFVSTAILSLSSLIFFLSLFVCIIQRKRKSREKAKMALQVQAATATSVNTANCLPSSLAPTANAGLRRPFNPFALKSSFFSGSLNLLHHPNQRHLTSGAPRVSMRVASKQAYICRDCGLPFTFVILLSFSVHMRR